MREVEAGGKGSFMGGRVERRETLAPPSGHLPWGPS